MIAREERAALRTFLRALRLLPAELRVARDGVVAPPARGARRPLGRALRDRVRFVDATQMSEARGDQRRRRRSCSPPRASARRRARSCARSPPQAVPVTSRLAPYEELLSEGRYGLEFEPGDVHTLAAQLERLLTSRTTATRSSSPRPSRCGRRSAGRG